MVASAVLRCMLDADAASLNVGSRSRLRSKLGMMQGAEDCVNGPSEVLLPPSTTAAGAEIQSAHDAEC